MKPLRLTIKAFGSYKDPTQIDFEKPSQNFFLITGDTGAGKTTIFDAIVFALYGEASSVNTKKDGAELQSQYASPEEEPSVVLEFSETEGGETCVYTVRRTPRYQRPIKWKTKEGVREIPETVSLMMPDGREYSTNKKEVNTKLSEIVGLTKDQFMQVAMIAQGEFMELLRASSDTKKVIFRKLFGTKLYQDVAEELLGRRKSLELKMAQIRTACQTEAGHIQVPEDYEKGSDLLRLQKKIQTSDRFSVSDTQAFISRLEELCDSLKDREKQAENEVAGAAKERDKARDAWTNAESLLKVFEQYGSAKKELEECKEKEEEIREKAGLMKQIEAAYEVQSVYLRFEEANKRRKQAEDKRTVLQNSLPELEKEDLKAAEEAAELQKQSDREKEQYSILSERVERALSVFEKAQAMQKESKKKTEDLEQLKKEQKEQEEKQKKEAEDAAAAYQAASRAYTDKNTEYMAVQTAFFDQQAGLLARQLEPGKPCPVCGSLEHPAPCPMNPGQEDLTREYVDSLAKELQELQEDVSKKAEESHKILNRPKDETKIRQIAEAEKTLAADEAALKELMKSADYESETEARSALNKAEETRKKAASLLAEALEKAGTAHTLHENAAGEIRRLTEEAPGLAKDCEERKTEYEKLREEKDLEEEIWQELTQKYNKTYAAELRETINDHEKKKAAAEKVVETSGEVIGEQTMPETEKLLKEKEESDQILKTAQAGLERVKEMRNSNKRALAALNARREERDAILQEYTLLDSLYSRIAGKISGARMDLETYVQRYYLNRILHAANLRFREMSAGQYELRMCDLEKAGEGKNHGLDLMVYSAVTGKEREIKTLSGGESFMAALCLALGLSDQIRESVASVNLDIMFIDEGFGSLDENARASAIRILKTMAGGDKMIGIISHVSELKAEIEDQLLVTKDECGSHVKWQIR